MIGQLPQSLNICGIDRAIRADFRVALAIFVAYNDIELNDWEKTLVLLECLYENYTEIPQPDIREAIEKAVLFLDGKFNANDEVKTSTKAKKVLDWEQDEQIVFSAVNKVAGCEIRSLGYLHWWTFLGYFNEISEGLLLIVISIRQKKNSGKKLEKHEQEFYREHRNMVDVKTTYTQSEQAEIDYYNKLLM